MRRQNRVLRSRLVVGLLYLVLLIPTTVPAAESPDKTAPSVLVELFLASERRGDLDAITRDLNAASVSRVRAQFFRLGHPPENIAIGSEVPADIARTAIRLAKTYNSDIKFLLPQFRFFPRHIVIGSSAFDEASQIPVSAADVERLADPALSTEQFHALYRRLTGEDQRRPTYLEGSNGDASRP